MAAGIIAEYNPFHAGHRYQIAEARRLMPDTEIVVVMSGSFTQRGEAAILDKYSRAEAAIEGGADLVLELPFSASCRSAPDFASGAIRLLQGLGVIDSLIFGAETADIAKMQKAAAVFSEGDFGDRLRRLMAAGKSYAAAVAQILTAEVGAAEGFFRQPNTILAVEYLRALPKNIKPVIIKRVGAGYADLGLTAEYASAAAIRAAIYSQNVDWSAISKSVSLNVLKNLQAEKISGLVQEKNLYQPLMAKIITTSVADMQKIFDCGEGLEFLILKSAKTAKNYSDIVTGIVNKRYTTSRVKRLLLYIMLGIFEFDAATYARILAFNSRGRQVIKKIKQASALPVITKLSKHLPEKQYRQKIFDSGYKKNLALDIAAAELRSLLFAVPKNLADEYLQAPRKI